MTREAIQSYAFDVAGLAFVGAAIYAGLHLGVGSPDFAVFLALGSFYLGSKLNLPLPLPKP